MLVRFRYSGRSSVSHYCLTRFFLSFLHVCLQPCLLVKRFRASKISRTATLWLLCCSRLFCLGASFQLPLNQRRVGGLGLGRRRSLHMIPAKRGGWPAGFQPVRLKILKPWLGAWLFA